MSFSRRFYFFDKDLLKDPLSKQPFDELKDVEVTCSTSGRGYLWFGDSVGALRRVDRSLRMVSFKAHERSVSLCYQMKQNDILVTVGHDEIPEDKIKVWNVNKWEGDGMPFCTRIVKATPSDTPESPVRCLEVMENMNYMVVGHQDGIVQLFKGDVTRERHSKRRVIQRCPRAVTGLGLQNQTNGIVVYVTTEASIMSIQIGPKDKEERTILDQFGCPPHCAMMIDHGSQSHFVVGYKDAIYFYEPDARGPCVAIEGEKVLIHFFKNYLVIVKQGNKTSMSGGDGSMLQLTIFDYINKFIAGDYQISDIKSVLSEWGSLFVQCGIPTGNSAKESSTPSNQIFRLTEKDTQSKLDLLFSKKNYNLAIEIARSQHYDEDGMADIFRRYADHLYKQKEYDGAIHEYIRTIGKLEASYVIQRFLDTSRIHNLTAYLQALHKAQLATEDHTTLLLNCYTKLKDEENLNKFLANDREVGFDVETAIRVLRQSSYNRQALDLAKRFKRHAWYLKILVEDMKEYPVALQYINSLPFDYALDGVCVHGKVLMTENPSEAAKVLEKLCSSSESAKLNVNDFLKIFANNREGLIKFLERYIHITAHKDIVPGVVDTLLELLLYQLSALAADKMEEKSALEAKIMAILENKILPYDRMKALMLCHQRSFKIGYLYLCEVSQDFDQMIRYHMENDDHGQVLETCRKFGQKCPELWTEALSYFAGKKECEVMIQEVINHIDKESLISPLMVIQLLAEGGKNACQLGVVKDFLLRRLEAGQAQVQADQATIKKFREETEENRQVIRKLKTKVKIFQMQKCTVCHQALDPPSVHFLCDHSYHMQCFQSYTDNETECPTCAPKNNQIKAEVNRWDSQRHNETRLDIASFLQSSLRAGTSHTSGSLPVAPPVSVPPSAGYSVPSPFDSPTLSRQSKTQPHLQQGVSNSRSMSNFTAMAEALSRGVMTSSSRQETVQTSAGVSKTGEGGSLASSFIPGIINQVKSLAQSRNHSLTDLGSESSAQLTASSLPSSRPVPSSKPAHQTQAPIAPPSNPFLDPPAPQISNPFGEFMETDEEKAADAAHLSYPEDLNPF